MNAYFGDVIKFVTYDGLELIIPSGLEVVALSYGGFGASPTDWITRRGYKQDGFTELGFQLNQRSIAITIHANPEKCSRAEYWGFRQNLNNYLRPNRGGPIRMELILSDGTKRALIVRANPGFLFPPTSQDENSWLIDETLEFIAFDPLWFDPDQVLDVLPGGYGTDLVFPITFDAGHIIFGPSGLYFTKNIVYNGTWKSYPKFIIDGPYDSVIIQNETTGIEIFLNIPIGLGEQRILDLTPGSQSLTDSNGLNCFGDLGPNSNLVDFCIEADPIAPGGVNIITVILIGSHGSAYYNLIQFDRPYHYYRLGELVGTDALDSGIAGISGTYIANPTLGVTGALAGDSDKAITLDGATQWVELPTLVAKNVSFSIEMWINPASLPPVHQSMFGIHKAYVAGELFTLRLANTGQIAAAYALDDIYTPAGVVTFGGISFYYIVYTYDFVTDISRIYVNGVLQSSGIAGPFLGDNPVIQIGAWDSANWFKGSIDEVAFYYQVLTQTQVSAHYAARLDAFSSGTEMDYYERYFSI